MKNIIAIIFTLSLFASCSFFDKPSIPAEAIKNMAIEAGADPEFILVDNKEVQTNNVHTIPGNYTNYELYEIEGVRYYHIYTKYGRYWVCPQTDRAIQYLAEMFEMGEFKWKSSIHNPDNQPFVLETAFNLGVPIDQVTQQQFEERYNIQVASPNLEIRE